ncbi:MAG: hypothetical protein AVDCRST_MAG76-1539, partial [uncultured Acidimicrobiales bacterium]
QPVAVHASGRRHLRRLGHCDHPQRRV